MRPEPASFQLTLTNGGRFVGKQQWNLRSDRQILTVEVDTQFTEALSGVQCTQVSRMMAQSYHSLHYHEGEYDARPSFETFVEHDEGMICLRQGREEARIPLVEDYHDPVSLLYWIRTLDGAALSKARLTGGTAYVQHIGLQEVSGVSAHVYVVCPGNAYVSVEKDAPHRILHLVQPCRFGNIEAHYAKSSKRSKPQRSQRYPKERRRVRR